MQLQESQSSYILGWYILLYKLTINNIIHANCLENINSTYRITSNKLNYYNSNIYNRYVIEYT